MKIDPGLPMLSRDLLPSAADNADQLLQLGRREAVRREGLHGGHRQRARRLQVPRVRKEVRLAQKLMIFLRERKVNKTPLVS